MPPNELRMTIEPTLNHSGVTGSIAENKAVIREIRNGFSHTFIVWKNCLCPLNFLICCSFWFSLYFFESSLTVNWNTLMGKLKSGCFMEKLLVGVSISGSRLPNTEPTQHAPSRNRENVLFVWLYKAAQVVPVTSPTDRPPLLCVDAVILFYPLLSIYKRLIAKQYRKHSRIKITGRTSLYIRLSLW